MRITTTSVTGPRAKLARADEHLDTLYAVVDAFEEGYAEGIDIELERNGAWRIVTVGPTLKPDVTRWGLIFGDAVQNARVALDHAACYLISAATGKEPSRWNAYPVFTTKRGFVDKVRSRKKNPEQSPLFGLPVDGPAWTFIEETQPYNHPDPDRDPLALLAYLSNRDKHRALCVHAVFPELSEMKWVTDSELLDTVPTIGPLSFERRTEVARLRFADPDAEVSMDGYLGLHPSFGDDPPKGGKGHQVSLAAFGMCVDAVDSILDELGF